MSEFGKPEVPSEAEKLKEVKKMGPESVPFKALISFLDLQKSGISEAEAADLVVKEFGLEKPAFTEYLAQLEKAKKSMYKKVKREPASENRFHTPEEIQDYQDRHPEHYA